MIHTPTAISIFVCLSMVQLMAVFISMRCTLCGHFLQVALTLILVVGYAIRSEERRVGKEFRSRGTRFLNTKKNINHTRYSNSDDMRNILCSSANMRRVIPLILRLLMIFFFSSRRRHTRSVSAFLLNRSSDLVQLMAVFISMRCTLCGHFLQVALTLILVVGYAIAASKIACKIRGIMVTVCPSQFATRRTLFHVLVGCGMLMLKVSRLKLPVIWLLVSMWLNTLTKSQIWTLLLKV